jgi:hypothetical protein
MDMRRICLKRTAKKMGFRTAIESLRNNASSPLARKADAASKAIRGNKIIGARWKDDATVLQTDDGPAIYFFVDGNDVGWDVIQQAQVQSLTDSWDSNEDEIELIRSTVSQERLSSRMDRHSTTCSFLGKLIAKIACDEFGAYVYFFGERKFIAFHAQHTEEHDEPFLEWFVDAD